MLNYNYSFKPNKEILNLPTLALLPTAAQAIFEGFISPKKEIKFCPS